MRTSLLSLLVIAAVGCSSKGSNGSDSSVTDTCHAEIASDGEVRWDEGGVRQCADVIAADRSIGSQLDFIEIAASTIKGPDVLISVSIIPPPSVGGTYTCGGDAGANTIFTFKYTTGTNMDAPPTSCTVTFTNTGAPGVHATGTFSATVTPPGGGSTSITNGFFDVPLFFLGD